MGYEKGLTRINKEMRHLARGKCRSAEYICRLSRVAQRVTVASANSYARYVDPHRRYSYNIRSEFMGADHPLKHTLRLKSRAKSALNLESD